MKKFLIKIRAYGYMTEFTVMAENSSQGIENAILDKLGKNEVIFEADGFTNKKGKWITYEEVIYDPRPIQTKNVLGVELATGV